MVTKDLYGIGKGSAQVVDLRPLNATIERREEANRARNEAKAQKKLANTVALNEQLSKLKNTAWREDREYVDSKYNEIIDWQKEMYAKYGEGSVSNTPELKKEFDRRVHEYQYLNDTSANYAKIAEENIQKMLQSPEKVDPETLEGFKSWREASSKERLSGERKLKLIGERKMTTTEAMREAGTKDAYLRKQVRNKGVGELVNGVARTWDNTTLPQDHIDEVNQNYFENKNGLVYTSAKTFALGAIDNEEFPETIEVDGETVENPKWREEVDRLIKYDIARSGKPLQPEDEHLGGKIFREVKEDKEDKSYGYRTGTGLNLSAFAHENKAGETTEGFTISNPKKALVPIEVTTIVNGKEQVVKVTPSEIVKSKKGNWVLKAAASSDTWEELTDAEKAKWKKENPNKNPISYDMELTKSENLNIPITSNIKAKLETQYGIVDLDKTLEEAKGYKKEGDKENTTPKRTNISSSEIEESAKKAGYSVKEYKKLLKEKGIEITD